MTNDESPHQAASLTLEQALQQAIAHHQAGRLQDAERLYRAILQTQPNHPDANHNLGVLAVQVGQHKAGLPHLKVALEANPNQGQYWLSYIDALIQAEQTDAARQVLLQGRQCGLQGEAVEVFVRRLGCANESAERSHSKHQTEKKPSPSMEEQNALVALLGQGHYADAATLARAMTVRFPMDGFGWKVLGTAFQQMGRFADALAAKQKVVELMPNDAYAQSNLGNILKDIGRLEEAEASYRRALQINPECAEIHNNLGSALSDLGRLNEAEVSYRRALQINPDYAEAYNNLGVALSGLGRLNEAEISYRRALQINPNYADASLNIAYLLLYLGKFEEGWKRYESRYDRALSRHLSIPPVESPPWRGESIAGKTLLVWHEQGLGDQIQFCRYLPILKARGCDRITLVCQAPLKSLLKRLDGVDAVLTPEEAAQIPPHGYWTFPGSIPLHCGTALENVPAAIPYLHADATHYLEIAKQLSHIEAFKVGLCWQGSKRYNWDNERSPGLEPFKKLFGIAGARFFTLQADSREEFRSVAGRAAVDLGHEIDALTLPFEETAALIMNLDLVITCDTSIGHLAGSLGKTVWVVLPFRPHWIWMEGREDSLWYPKTRLFRQKRRGDWEELFDRVKLRLIAVIAGESSALWPVASAPCDEISGASIGRTVSAPISVGELLDKITILEIKVMRIADDVRQVKVASELSLLTAVRDVSLRLDTKAVKLVDELREVNSLLWDVEDEIRECERVKNFDSRFVELARSVYHYNDRRALLKRQLNELTGSDLVEEKLYTRYSS